MIVSNWVAMGVLFIVCAITEEYVAARRTMTSKPSRHAFVANVMKSEQASRVAVRDRCGRGRDLRPNQAALQGCGNMLRHHAPAICEPIPFATPVDPSPRIAGAPEHEPH